MTEVAQPIAWLLREMKLGRARIMPGHCFKSAERADAAAARMSGRWRTVTAVPVQETAQKKGHADGR